MNESHSKTADTPKRSDEDLDTGEVEDRVDQMYKILQHEKRRHVLRYLLKHESVELGDLAEHIAAVESGKSRREITAQERKNVSIGLFQLHLPKMHIGGAVAYNQSRGIIEQGEDFDRFKRYLPMER